MDILILCFAMMAACGTKMRRNLKMIFSHAKWRGTNQNPIALAAIEMSSVRRSVVKQTSKETHHISGFFIFLIKCEVNSLSS